jgi:hypothetical protein
VERAHEQHAADHHRREHRSHSALYTATEQQRVKERETGGEAEEQEVEAAGAVRECHQHFRAPLLRHPRRAFKGVAERIGLRDAAIQNDLADLNVPERTGVGERAVAERGREAEPRENEERRFRSEEPFHARSRGAVRPTRET